MSPKAQLDEKTVSHIYQSYRSQLKAYKKLKFDPFRRRQRISFYYNKEEYLNTTIGQLNFFKWSIENNIIEYITSHIHDLEESMNDFQKNSKKKKVMNQTQIEIDSEEDESVEVINTKNLQINLHKSLVYFN
jgi:hypothetical protein